MDYKELVERLEDYTDLYMNLHHPICHEAAEAITALLSRAEAAEAKGKELEEKWTVAFNVLKELSLCETCGSFEEHVKCGDSANCRDCDEKCGCCGCRRGNRWNLKGLK